MRRDNIQDFADYAIQFNKLEDAIRSAFRRQARVNNGQFK